VILHYLINKNDVVKIAKEWQQQSNSTTAAAPSTRPVSLEAGDTASGVMEFALTTTQPGAPTVVGTASPGQAATAAPTSSVNATSTDLLSDTGGIHVNVDWSPTPIPMNAESSAKFNFTDAFSGGDLNADVLYDLSALDSNGAQVFEKTGLTAKNSQDTQAIKFPAAGIYQIVLTIKGIQQTPADQKSETPPIDNTRNGIARGTVVVSGQTDQTAAAPPAPPSNNSLTEQQPQEQNQTAAAPPAPPAPPSNNSLTEQQPQEQNQTVDVAPPSAAPALSNDSPVEQQQEQQNPFGQLGDAISNMFGGGK
jgi:hypothetical protein